VKTQTIIMKNELNLNTYMHITGLEMTNCTILDAIYSGSLLTNNVYSGVTFRNCTFYACNLDANLFLNCTFENCIFQFSHFHSSSFENCEFNNNQWLKTHFAKNEFMGCQLDEAAQITIDGGINFIKTNSLAHH
jgi:uncharacterized protein YjbI with pentapeptide repeats